VFEQHPGELWYAAGGQRGGGDADAQGMLGGGAVQGGAGGAASPARVLGGGPASAAARDAAPAAAGWRRQADTLTQVVVRDAGHMVPRDQPQAAQRMLYDWVAGVLADDGGDGDGGAAADGAAMSLEVSAQRAAGSAQQW
jgi:hypothetical protein